MEYCFKKIYLKKRFPLAISRGIHEGSENLFISVTRDGISGWGELSPGANEGAETADAAQNALEKFLDRDISHLSVQQVYDLGIDRGLPLCALAGLDIALWDWLGKKANLPLYRLLGLGRPAVPTSVTIGISSAETVRERIPLLLAGTGIKSLKIKLGSPEGIDADREMFQQVVESTKNCGVSLRVDANGGWTADDAVFMMKWLSERNTDYVEQPLKEGGESELPKIFKDRPLPIYLDESCRVSADIKSWWRHVDGVNVKLMKCGGITGALRIITVAKLYGLKTMIGCMGESSMSISAGAAITGLADHVDLDSQLNLDPDPCRGAALVNGIIAPNDLPGHGASLNEDDEHA